MFDAGAIIGKMQLNIEQFEDNAQKVLNKVDEMGQAMQRSGQQMNAVSRQIGVVGRNLAFFGTGIVAPMILALFLNTAIRVPSSSDALAAAAATSRSPANSATSAHSSLEIAPVTACMSRPSFSMTVRSAIGFAASTDCAPSPVAAVTKAIDKAIVKNDLGFKS